MKRLRNSQGFTLIELVVIILVLGILAVTAIPRFVDLQNEAKDAACDGVVGAVRGGIAVIYASNILNSVTPVWPADLDGEGSGTNSSGTFYFDNVLDIGIDNGDWQKTDTAGNDTYVCDPTNLAKSFTYNPTTGAFN